MGLHAFQEHHDPHVRLALGGAHLVDELEGVHQHLGGDGPLFVAVEVGGVRHAADGGGGRALIQTGPTPELANEKNAGMASKVASGPPSPERE